MNLLELILLSTAICMIGLISCFYNLFWATVDYRNLEHIFVNRSGRTIIIGRALQEITRLVGLAIFLGINLDVLNRRTGPELAEPVMWQRTTVLLLALETFLMVNSVIGAVVNIILNVRRSRARPSGGDAAAPSPDNVVTSTGGE